MLEEWQSIMIVKETNGTNSYRHMRNAANTLILIIGYWDDLIFIKVSCWKKKHLVCGFGQKDFSFNMQQTISKTVIVLATGL